MLRKKKFDGRGNGADAGAQVKYFAVFLCKDIWENSDHTPNQNEQLDQIILACALYCVLLNQLIDEELQKSDRVEFADAMITEIVAELASASDSPSEVIGALSKKLIDAIKNLTPYANQLLPEKDESPTGTLYWEFGKMLHDESFFEITGTVQGASYLGTELIKSTKDSIYSNSKLG